LISSLPLGVFMLLSWHIAPYKNQHHSDFLSIRLSLREL
jgi:hypothetical protein